MKLLARFAWLLLAGCGTYQPPPRPTPRDASHVDASMGATWDAVIDLFATRNIPIRTIERASGLIVTDPLRVGEEGSAWANCGVLNGRVLGPTRATYNVLVRGDSAAATVRTTVLWIRTHENDEPVECTSSYIWERGLETDVKARAERQGRPDERRLAGLVPARPDPPPAVKAPPAPTAPAAPPTARTGEDLMKNAGFRRAITDAQLAGLVLGFREVGVDTLALELADLALTSPSTDQNLGRLYLAYRGTTEYRPASAMQLFHDGQRIGWYTSSGLAWGVVR
jgi:hypothetical protein